MQGSGVEVKDNFCLVSSLRTMSLGSSSSALFLNAQGAQKYDHAFELYPSSYSIVPHFSAAGRRCP